MKEIKIGNTVEQCVERSDYPPEKVKQILSKETIAIAQALGVERTIMFAVAGLAQVILTTPQPERAAHLLGAIAAKQDATGFVDVLADMQVRQTVVDARAALGDVAFTHGWEAGRHLLWADAIRVALAAL